MQSPLFGYTEVRTEDRYTLQNEQMLRVALDGRTEVLARSGAMVAHTGQVSFTSWQGQRGGSGNRNSSRNNAQSRGGLDLMRCSGTGTVYLANMAQHLHLLDLQRERLTVTSSYVLAMDTSVGWTVVTIEGGERIAGVGAYSLELGGSGTVALMTSGRPLVMRVEPGAYCYADADAVVGWSSDLHVQLMAQSSNTEVWRRRGTATEGWEMSFTGSGYVVVQPSELLPPQRIAVQGVAGQFGVGSGGFRDNSING